MLKKSGCTAVLLLCGFAMFTQNFHDFAFNHIKKQRESWGLTQEDISELQITDSHISSISGVRHIYLQQFRESIPIREGLASVHITPEGEIIHQTKSLISNVSAKLNQLNPTITSERAVIAAAQKLNIPYSIHLKTLKKEKTKTQNQLFEGRSISTKPIPASLSFELNKEGNLRLCWQIEIQPHDSNNYWVMRMDAKTGEEINRENRVVTCDFPRTPLPKGEPLPTKPVIHDLQFVEGCSTLRTGEVCEHTQSFTGQYNAFHLPIESPLYGTRSLKTGTDIINTTAAPYGWHDTDGNAATIEYQYTRGNHVYAYYAPVGTADEPNAISINCLGGNYLGGIVPWPVNSLEFTYNNDLNSATGTDFVKDAITNLFVWNNYCHDVSYLYGFDEAAGNFQITNHTGQGTGNDYILARGQDGSGTNNASFQRKVEGEKPVMKMFLWTTNLPTSSLDSDFDNLVIAHEYGHGITSRLLGGPSNVSCFGSTEHGDEGWADFFGLMMTLQDYDGDGTLEENVIGEGIRGIGNYLRNDGTAGCDDNVGTSTCGLRPTAYTTDMNINPFTYGNVPNMAQPHGVGFVWCTMLWEMTWNLIIKHGFEADIFNTSSTAGNIVALKLVIEGLKNTACNPSFIDMRDAILAADVSINSGANQDEIWAAFAKRGLGFSATAGGNEAFDLPTIALEKTVDKEESERGQTITYTLTAKNNSSGTLTNVIITDVVPSHLNVTSISNGGTESGGTITWPAFGSIAAGNSETVNFTADIENTAPETTVLQENDLETSITEFTPAGIWQWVDNVPASAHSGKRFWEHLHSSTVTVGDLILDLDLTNSNNYHLVFWHWFDMEAGFDGGVVEVSTDAVNYSDLGSKMIKNGYNGSVLGKEPMGIPLSVLGGRRAFSGQSGGYIKTIIDLSTYSGTSSVKIRFRIATDEDNSIFQGDGWRLDDFQLLDFKNIENEGCVTETSQNFNDCGDVGDVGTIVYVSGVLPIELIDFQAIAQREDILLKWETTFEKYFLGFEIQRSIDALLWKKIGWKDAENTTNQLTRYEFIDKNIKLNTTYYYRLKMMDVDANFEYSNIVSAGLNQDNFGLKVYPNPTNGVLNLLFETPLKEESIIEIYNPNGQKIVKTSLSAGDSFTSIKLNEFPPNFYFLKVSNEQQVIVKKFIRQKK